MPGEGSGADRRSRERIPVRLQVKFRTALEFVTEYAENLSVGGLFLRGAQNLTPLSQIGVELQLPGFGSFEVIARVAHIIDPQTAAQQNRRPGAGIEITSHPDGFDEALSEYLRRLGRRRDVAVLVELGLARELLGAAGFQLASLPPPDELVAALARASHPVIAVVVPRSREAAYRAAANSAGVADLLRPFDYEEEIDQLLTALDELL